MDAVKKIGKIMLLNDVMVSDPCHKIGTWCQKKLSNILPGWYNCYAVIKEYEEEQKVSQLLAVHTHRIIEPKDEIDTLCCEYVDASIGVDAGLCGIYDNRFYENMANSNTWHKYCQHIEEAALIGDNDKRGVVSSSGIGYGSYDLYVQRSELGNIDFICLDYDLC